MDVNRAFLEWCAVSGFSPSPREPVGSYRLARTADDKVQIELVLADGSVEAIAPAMPEAAFCDAVQLVSATFRIKTVQVARTVARRMGDKRRRKPGT